MSPFPGEPFNGRHGEHPYINTRPHRLARHHHPVRPPWRPGGHGRRRPGHARPDRHQGQRPQGAPDRPGQSILAGFAGATADAFTLLERLEAKLERFPGQLERACVELAKDWRTDRYLRRLEAMMAVADKDRCFTLTGNGDVLEPEDGIIAIGSGGNYALAAARALIEVPDLDRRGNGPPRHEDRRRNLRLYQRVRHRRDDRR